MDFMAGLGQALHRYALHAISCLQATSVRSQQLRRVCSVQANYISLLRLLHLSRCYRIAWWFRCSPRIFASLHAVQTRACLCGCWSQSAQHRVSALQCTSTCRLLQAQPAVLVVGCSASVM